MVGARGFEPPTSWTQTRRATRLRYAPTHLIHRYTKLFEGASRKWKKTLKKLLHIEFSLIDFLWYRICENDEKRSNDRGKKEQSFFGVNTQTLWRSILAQHTKTAETFGKRDRLNLTQ